jgi:hypothetical protein
MKRIPIDKRVMAPINDILYRGVVVEPREPGPKHGLCPIHTAYNHRAVRHY